MKTYVVAALSLFASSLALADGTPTNVEVTKPIDKGYAYSCTENGVAYTDYKNDCIKEGLSARATDKYTNAHTYDGSKYSVTYYLGAKGSPDSCTISARMWCTGIVCQTWHNEVKLASTGKLNCTTSSVDNPFQITLSVK